MNVSPKIYTKTKSVRFEPEFTDIVEKYCKKNSIEFSTITRELWEAFIDKN